MDHRRRVPYPLSRRGPAPNPRVPALTPPAKRGQRGPELSGHRSMCLPFAVGRRERELRSRRRRRSTHMTTQKSFKRLVRARMEKTGESYTSARSALLTTPEPGAEPVLTSTDASIRERTGRGWEECVDVLDEWGAAERSHKEIARWVLRNSTSSRWAGTRRRSRSAT